MMKTLLLSVMFLLVVNSINAQLSPAELGVAYQHSEKASDNSPEIFTVKCSDKMLGYIINHLYNWGFRIVSMSCNEPVEPIWVINYVSMQ